MSGQIVHALYEDAVRPERGVYAAIPNPACQHKALLALAHPHSGYVLVAAWDVAAPVSAVAAWRLLTRRL